MVASAALLPQFLILESVMRLPIRQRLWCWFAYVMGNVIVLAPLATRHYFLSNAAAMAIVAFVPASFLLILLRRSVQPFIVLLLSLIVSITVLGAPFWNEVPDVDPGRVFAGQGWLIALEVVSVVFGAYGAYWASRLLRQPSVGVFVGSYLISLAGSWLLLPGHRDISLAWEIVGFLAASLLQGVVLWSIFRLLTSQSVRKIVTNDIVQAQFCWAFLTLFFEASTKKLGPAGRPANHYMYDRPLTARFAFLLAFVAEVLVLVLLLRAIRRRRPLLPLKRMLLLRAFGGAYRREDLLDDLENSWRRLGSVEVLAGEDVAERTLVPTMIEALLAGNVQSQFFRTPADIAAGLAQRQFEIQPDVRYPVHAFYCTRETWRETFTLLAAEVDVVLMDLRGFQRSNEGCAWELDYLGRNYDHKRVVFVVDGRTDLEFASEIIASSAAGEAFSAVVVQHTTRAERDRLFETILSAAFV
jgi:hypothetical protein